MPESPDNADRPKQPPRPWYRLHLSTCVVLVLLTAPLVLLIVPGDSEHMLHHSGWRPRPTQESRGELEHGWPFVYLRVSEPVDPEPAAIPWLARHAWSFAGSAKQFRPGNLAIDIVVAMLILIVAGITFECRRRRQRNAWQFRLWELLASFLLVAGALAWWQTWEKRSQKESKAIARICTGLNARRHPVPGSVYLVGPAIGPGASLVQEYRGPRCLKKLIPGAYLSKFYGVVFVCISGPLDDTDLQQTRQDLDCFPDLERAELIVSYPSYGIEPGPAAKPGADSVNSVGDSIIRHTGPRVTDAGVAHLAGLTQLTDLRLQGALVGNAGAKHLSALENLHVLDLSETQIGDQGLKHLAPLRQLSYLSLSKTAVTDTGLVYLQQMRNLQCLYLNDTQVSGGGAPLHCAPQGTRHVDPLKDTGQRYSVGSLAQSAESPDSLAYPYPGE